MVTIKEIAEIAGVSTTTVSNVLHKKTARVSAETIEKVQKLLVDNNYIPRLGLNALTNKNSRIISILINTPSFARGSVYESPFYGRIIGMLEELLRKKGYYIMIFSDKNVEEIEKMTLGWNVDGIISISMPLAYCKKISELSDKPMVSIDMGELPSEKEKIYLVTSEDEKAGFEMSEYLISNGAKKIIYLANDAQGADYQRYLGTMKAAEKENCEIEIKLLPIEAEGRQSVYEELLKYAGTDTALFFSTDKNAAEMISFLNRNNIKVPEEISVAGIDDDVFATIVYPTLTTMKIDVEEKANVAVEILMKLINGEICMPYVYKTKVQLIERESVKKIKAESEKRIGKGI